MNGNPSEKSRARFGKASRLLKHADFDRVYRQGKRHFSANLTVFWVRRAEQEQDDSARRARTLRRSSGQPTGATPRIGFTVGKALGGAVVRNRIKRRLREAVRMNLSGFSSPVDVVINPKKSALTADMPKLKQEVSVAFGAIEKNSPQRAQRDTKDKE